MQLYFVLIKTLNPNTQLKVTWLCYVTLLCIDKNPNTQLKVTWLCYVTLLCVDKNPKP
jgi:hypothetical protein